MDSIIQYPLVLIVFFFIVITMLILDLGVFNKNRHIITFKEAAKWTIFWISLSMLFSLFIYFETTSERFFQFQSAYWIEKSLSIDNLFVFILVFNYFNVERESQHKVLFWGIIGAIFLRAIFIFTGVELINITYLPSISVSGKILNINLLLTIFGLFLIYGGIKSWFVNEKDDGEKDFSKSLGAKFVHFFFKVSKEFDKDNFFTVENGIKMATPLLVVVGVIEFTDLLFAIDSIPAIFSIAPDDPFILYTSNILAILGLRSMFFILSDLIHLFNKLKYGLAIILIFIGVKMVISPLYHIDSLISLIIVVIILFFSILASLLKAPSFFRNFIKKSD